MTSHIVTCPSCQKRLRIAESASDFTCPRCLAKISVGIQAEPPQPSSSAPEGVTGSATCRSCGRIVEKVWGYCPFCRTPLDQPRRVRRRLSVDKEAHRDISAIGAGMVLISLLGGLGIIFFFCGSPGGRLQGQIATQQAGTAGVIISAVLFGAVVVGMVLASKSHSEVKRTSTIITGALAIPLLLLAGVISWFVYVCGGCSFK